MNYSALTAEELGRLAETDEAARCYIANNARDVLVDLDERNQAWRNDIYEDGLQEGLDTGHRDCRRDLREKFDNRIEEAMAGLMGKHTEPENMPKKRRKAWELLGDILHELEFGS